MIKISVCFLVASSCLCCVPQAEAGAPPQAALSVEQETYLREVGGDELVADAHAMAAAEGGQAYLDLCLLPYAKATELQNNKVPAAELLAPLMSCQQACVASGDLESTATKYRTRCDERRGAVDAGTDLELARQALRAFQDAESAVSRAQHAKGADGALASAEAKLGPDHPELQQMRVDYEAATTAHAEEIAKGNDFLERADIVDLIAEMRELEEEIRLLTGSYEKHRHPETRRLIEVKQARLRTLEDRWNAEGAKAGAL